MNLLGFLKAGVTMRTSFGERLRSKTVLLLWLEDISLLLLFLKCSFRLQAHVLHIHKEPSQSTIRICGCS